MHPILVSGRRLLAYLAAWIPLVALLVFVASAAGGMSWMGAAAVLTPASLFYAFVCLSPWYLARVRPLGPAAAPSLAGTWMVASSVGGLLLAGSAALISWAFATPLAGSFARSD